MPNLASSYYLGIDIGGTKSGVVIGTADGTILHRVGGPTPHGPDASDAVAALIEMAREICRTAGIRPSDAAGVGISCGGPLNSKRGVVLNPPNLPEWRDVPISALICAELDVPTAHLENDANATALAEHCWGAGRGLNDLAYLTFGTGMGAGLILNGALYRGKSDFAGEIGHATIIPDGPPCLCGKHGCLETLTSGGALDRIAREKFHDPTATAATVCERARAGDALAMSIIDDASRYLGIGIANLLQTLDLEMVILGSMALKAGDLFLEPIRRYTREYAWAAVCEGVQIVPAGLGTEAQDKAALAVALKVD